MRSKVLVILLSLCLHVSGQGKKMSTDELMGLAQSNPDMISSIYRAYPTPSQAYTSAPSGYNPVFISHYGRHGSRFVTEDERYLWLIGYMEDKQLTDKGKALLERIRTAWGQAEGRGGDLTELGEQQHRDIATRMYAHFPSLFKGNTTLNAYSSTSRRCMMSMMAFCESLKEHNAQLIIKREASERNMRFISYTEPMKKAMQTELAQEGQSAYQQLRKASDKTAGFMKRIFQNPNGMEDVYKFMEQVYFLAQDMQDCGHPTEMLSFFTPEELYSIWEVKNCELYLQNGDSPLSHGIPALCSDSLISHIVYDADKAIREKRQGATLRFGHDTALLKLLTRMKVSECCPTTSNMNTLALAWQDFNIVPMAGNVQLVFYQNNEGHVMVRILLNENEVHLPIPSASPPYYDWEEVKQLWKTLPPPAL